MADCVPAAHARKPRLRPLARGDADAGIPDALRPGRRGAPAAGNRLRHGSRRRLVPHSGAAGPGRADCPTGCLAVADRRPCRGPGLAVHPEGVAAAAWAARARLHRVRGDVPGAGAFRAASRTAGSHLPRHRADWHLAGGDGHDAPARTGRVRSLRADHGVGGDPVPVGGPLVAQAAHALSRRAAGPHPSDHLGPGAVIPVEMRVGECRPDCHRPPRRQRRPRSSEPCSGQPPLFRTIAPRSWWPCSAINHRS